MRGKLRDTRGLTLMELVIAVAVLAIGTIGSVRATQQSSLALAGAEARLLAQIVVENRAEELRLHGNRAGRALPRQVQMGRRSFRLEVVIRQTAADLREARIRAVAETGEGATLVAILPSARATP